MLNLDDIKLISRVDKSDQLGVMCNWAKFIKEARKLAISVDIPSHIKLKKKEIRYHDPKSIVITGMGGSSIVGDYLISCFNDTLSIPVIVNRDYFLPNFVDDTTLVICVSYSGNTEETLACFQDALTRGSQTIAVSSNGKLSKFCSTLGIPFFQLRQGQPPRTALPLIYTTLITILERFSLLPDLSSELEESQNVLYNLSKVYKPGSTTDSNEAKQIANKLYNTIPHIIGHNLSTAIAYRAKCQFNENTKLIAIAESIPEQNHNGIVAWGNPITARQDMGVIFLVDTVISKPIQIRIKETIKTVKKHARVTIEIKPKGKSRLARQLSLTYLIDFISIYLAILYEVDPTTTSSIDNLKDVLKKENIVKDIQNALLQ